MLDNCTFRRSVRCFQSAGRRAQGTASPHFPRRPDRDHSTTTSTTRPHLRALLLAAVFGWAGDPSAWTPVGAARCCARQPARRHRRHVRVRAGRCNRRVALRAGGRVVRALTQAQALSPPLPLIKSNASARCATECVCVTATAHRSSLLRAPTAARTNPDPGRSAECE